MTVKVCLEDSSTVFTIGVFKAGTYAPIDSPTFTGTPKAPTAPLGTNTTQIATTEFVKREIDYKHYGYGNIVTFSVSEVTS